MNCSALNATGPVLAEVIGVAGLGSLYFVAGNSGDGLQLVTVAMAVLLTVAAIFAAPVMLRRDG